MIDINSIKELYESTKHRKRYSGLYQKIIKRVIDILLCLLALPFFIVIMLVVGVLIKLEDGGPVFYHSKRLGLEFKEFDMIKFRSMKTDAPDIRNNDGSTFNSANDFRVTKIGKKLRETSIDETPQIINVLRGEMSIIGPRAGDVESKNTYEEDEKDKLLIRPGITGYTQAYFRNNIGVREKRLYDAWYAHNVSFLMDIKIFIRTIKTVISSDNIYTNT
ncbi:MAG: sugar transferase [Anaerococcus sp.]|nr:sugar transferase [Anaerococcus sp.]